MKKIAYITGTRADFGLMTSVLAAIQKSEKLELQLYATGMHLMSDFGNTIDHVKKQFPDTKIIPTTFTTDDKSGTARFTGDFLTEAVSILSRDKPDFILVLGDRVEMLCTALVALYLGIPTAQIHGGERTSTVDEIARHAITKLVSLHLAATVDSAERIKKLGEEDWRIHVVGAPALDIILNEVLPTREKIFQKLNIDPQEKIILVIQHPVTDTLENAGSQMEKTLEAVKTFNMPVIVVYPNADAGGREMVKVIEKQRNNPNFHIFPSLEYKDFLALEKETSVMVGNSSAGIIEAASFQVPVVNVGDRQLNRAQNENIINVGYNKSEIIEAIGKSLQDEQYLNMLKSVKNIWGDGKTGLKVVSILEKLEFDERLMVKQITY